VGILPVYDDSKLLANLDWGTRALVGERLRRVAVCTVLYVYLPSTSDVLRAALTHNDSLLAWPGTTDFLFSGRSPGRSSDSHRLFMILLGFQGGMQGLGRLKKRATIQFMCSSPYAPPPFGRRKGTSKAGISFPN